MTINIEGFGKITANEVTMNSLSWAFHHAEKYMLSKGYDENADIYREYSKEICDKLKEIGYYD